MRHPEWQVDTKVVWLEDSSNEDLGKERKVGSRNHKKRKDDWKKMMKTFKKVVRNKDIEGLKTFVWNGKSVIL